MKDPDDPKKKKKKQPYFIRLKEEGPMFLAALAEVHQGLEQDSQDGFVIITADSDQGMVDIHDRRPVVLSAEHAREWIDPETTQGARYRDLQRVLQPDRGFTWFEVSKYVGNVRNQGPHLITPNQKLEK